MTTLFDLGVAHDLLLVDFAGGQVSILRRLSDLRITARTVWGLPVEGFDHKFKPRSASLDHPPEQGTRKARTVRTDIGSGDIVVRAGDLLIRLSLDWSGSGRGDLKIDTIDLGGPALGPIVLPAECLRTGYWVAPETSDTDTIDAETTPDAEIDISFMIDRVDPPADPDGTDGIDLDTLALDRINDPSLRPGLGIHRGCDRAESAAAPKPMDRRSLFRIV